MGRYLWIRTLRHGAASCISGADCVVHFSFFQYCEIDIQKSIVVSVMIYTIHRVRKQTGASDVDYGTAFRL